MKRIVKILGIVIIAALIAVMIIINNTNGAGEVYRIRVGTDKKNVAPGDKFTITLDLSNSAETSMLNGTLEYNNKIFSCDSVSSVPEHPGKFSVSQPDDGTKAFVFVGQDVSGNSSATISQIKFNFSAKSGATGEGEFTISSKRDFSIITSDNNNYAYNVFAENGSTLSTTVSIQVPEEPKEPVLSDENITLQIDESKKVTVTNGVSVTWESDKPEVAVVDNGNITAKSAGTAHITAKTAEGKTATVTVTVNQKQDPGPGPGPGDNEQAPTLSETNIVLYVNETKKITVTNGVAIMGWRSVNPSIVEIKNTDGTIEAKSVGTTTIIATAENGKTATANVEVKEGTRPTNPGDQPGNSGDQPGNSGDQPGNSGDQPGNSGDQPGNSGDQPGNSGDQPGNSGDQPGNSGNQPGNSGDQPGNVGGQKTNTSTPGTSTNYTGTNGTQGQTGNSSSTAEEEVPATGESTVGTVIIIAIVTLIVASIIFRRKSKIK